MEDLVEALLELVLEGSFEASRSRIVPMPVRIVLAALVVLFVLALSIWHFFRAYGKKTK